MFYTIFYTIFRTKPQTSRVLSFYLFQLGVEALLRHVTFQAVRQESVDTLERVVFGQEVQLTQVLPGVIYVVHDQVFQRMSNLRTKSRARFVGC